jgi:DNA-binding transcriptional regulator YbjK
VADEQRRTHSPRGRRRREALLRAALRVIAERGIAGTTHRAVAAAAGVPLATTTYYFSSLDELLEAALERYVEDEIARLEEVARRVLAHDGTVDEAIAAVAAELAAGDGTAQLELYVEATRRPGLQPVVERAQLAYRRLAADLLRHVGCPEADRLAPYVVAILDGLGLHHLARRPTDREAQVAEALRALLRPWLEATATRPASSTGAAAPS